jgi:hypothetical protein
MKSQSDSDDLQTDRSNLGVGRLLVLFSRPGEGKQYPARSTFGRDALFRKPSPK